MPELIIIMPMLRKILLFTLTLAAILAFAGRFAFAQTSTQASFYFTQGSDCAAQPATSIAVSQQPFTLNLCLNTNASGIQYPINGFNIEMNYGSALTLTSVSEQQDADKFEGTTAYGPPQSIDNTAHSFHYSRVTTVPRDSLPGGTLFLATLNFTPVSGNSSGVISVSKSIVISPQGALTSNSPSLSYGQSNIQGHTYISFNLSLKDVYSPNNPLRTTLPVTVCLYGPKNGQYPSAATINADLSSSNPCEAADIKTTGSIIYKSVDGSGNAVFGSPNTYFDLGSSIATDSSYMVALKPAEYLAYVTTNPVSIIYGQTPQGATNVIPPGAKPLTAGDINGDNKIDILDYNALNTCEYESINPQPIDPNGSCASADIDGNGLVDGIDFNIWDRGFLSSSSGQ